MATVTKTLLDLENDAINKALLDGLLAQFKKELKDELMRVAETEVDSIVGSVSERLRVVISSYRDFDTRMTHVKLEWLLKKFDTDIKEVS